MKNQINTTKRVALYARVSTLDKGQDPETQLVQLRQYAEYSDEIEQVLTI